MGQAKIRQQSTFSSKQLDEWESDDCVNFAVALARLTGWLIHVDWWDSSGNHERDSSHDQLLPLRVYVGDHRDQIFDLRGVKPIQEFNMRTTAKLVRDKRLPMGGASGVRTRYYSEAKLATLPLRVRPDEGKILHAMGEIEREKTFLASVPKRAAPYIPSYEAAQFTFGLCAAFAQALHVQTGLQPVAILARRFSPHFVSSRGKNGFVHCVVMHEDGMAEDSWGKTTLEDIAERFGLIEYVTSASEHETVVSTLRQNSPERFEAAYGDATRLIQAYRT